MGRAMRGAVEFRLVLIALMVSGAVGYLGWRLVWAPQSAPVAAGDEVERPCPADVAIHWRSAQRVDGVDIEADRSCLPDDPHLVAAVVRGTNRALGALMATRLARDAVVKGRDLDGDGDPDDIHVKLEIAELNGFSPDLPVPSLQFPIAPGITPGIWVFTPKTRGMATSNFLSNDAHDLLRLPSPAIRVEQGDRVRITIENTHYLPHTLHLHGVDHPFRRANGQGNDGVPMVSEMAIQPGGARTYEFTPRQPGTFFYHCHVQPQAHILMGLAGMLVVEENRPDNRLQTLNIGGGRVRHRSVASREHYDREYDLHYQDMDRNLHNLIQRTNDARSIARAMNLEYKIGERQVQYHLLNGRSFPYTLRESQIVVAPDETVKLRTINSGESPVYLHPHGHKPTVTHLDGVALEAPITRDVIHIGPAQRVDMELRTTNDGLHSYGQGVWFMHDHRESGVTTDGINPGGDITTITYESFLDESGMPETAHDISIFFDPAYYRGEIDIFEHMDPGVYGGASVPQNH